LALADRRCYSRKGMGRGHLCQMGVAAVARETRDLKPLAAFLG